MNKNSSYMTSKNGYKPQTPIEVIISDYAEQIEKDNLGDEFPIAAGVFALQIPVWPKSYQGNKFSYEYNLKKKRHSVKWPIPTFIPILLDIDTHNHIPKADIINTGKDNKEKNKIANNAIFHPTDFDENPNCFYVVSVNKHETDIKPGDIIGLRNEFSDVPQHMHKGHIVSFIPRSAISSCKTITIEKGDSNE